MATVIAAQGDTVDSLCWSYYGRTAGVTEAVLDANDSEQEADKGWFLVKGKARLDGERLDKQQLPLTLITASSLLACQEDECADLRDPLTLLRHEIGDPNWTVEGARDVVKQAWPDRAVEQGDEQ